MVFRVFTFLFLAAEILAAGLGHALVTLPLHALTFACAFMWIRRVPEADGLVRATFIAFALQVAVIIGVHDRESPVTMLALIHPIFLLVLLGLLANRHDLIVKHVAPVQTHLGPPAPYRSNQQLALTVVILLGAQIVTSLVIVAIRAAQVPLLRAEEIDLEALKRLDTVASFSGALHALAYLATAVCFLVWLYRVHRNLPALGSQSVLMSPKQAVTGWFIPFVNLQRGYTALRHVWLESQPGAVLPSGEPLPRRATLIGWWWALYLINNVVGRALSKVGENPTIDSFVAAVPIWTAEAALNAIAATLAILVVLGVARRQREQWTDMLQRVPAPPAADRLR
jgi:hypothetical protein